MLDKYIVIEEKDIVVGQNASGIWYCKELKAKTIEEAGNMMIDMNRKLNSANQGKKIVKSKKEEKNQQVRGIKEG